MKEDGRATHYWSIYIGGDITEEHDQDFTNWEETIFKGVKKKVQMPVAQRWRNIFLNEIE